MRNGPSLEWRPSLAAALLFFAGLLAVGLPPSEAVNPLNPQLTSRKDDNELRIEGVIDGLPRHLDDGVGFTLLSTTGRFEAFAPLLDPPLSFGDHIIGRARLDELPLPLNPGEPNRSAAARLRSIRGKLTFANPPVRLNPPGLLTRLEASRIHFAVRAAALLPTREAALIAALGVGDRAGIDHATNQAFAQSGLAHILSVSGLHLALIAVFLYSLFQWSWNACNPLALRWDSRRPAALTTLTLVWGYALATGAEVPTVRSGVMAALGLLAMTLEREPDGWSALAIAALLVLGWDPSVAFDPSFQLSFTSVAALMWAGHWSSTHFGELGVSATVPVRGWWTKLGAWFVRTVLGLLKASLIATWATLPLTAFHFQRIGLWGALANLVGIPIGSALTLLAAAAAFPLSWWPAAQGWVLLASRPVASSLLWVADCGAALPGASWGLASPGWVGVVLFYCASFAATRFRTIPAIRWLAPGLALVSLTWNDLTHTYLARLRGGVEWISIAVGQGDSTVLRLPHGGVVLMDGGGNARGSDPGERAVLPLLRQLGVHGLEAMVVSHPHADHLLGLPAVAQGMPVRRLLTNGRLGDPGLAGVWPMITGSGKVSPLSVHGGMSFWLEGVRFDVRGPPENRVSQVEPDPLSENDASLVLRLSWRACTALMAGDVESEGEALLTDRADDLSSQLVKAPHHGSRTSSGWRLVRAVQATDVVLSLGRGNRFGFPAPEVVKRWRMAGAQVARTDFGAARYICLGKRFEQTQASDALSFRSLMRFGTPPE